MLITQDWPLEVSLFFSTDGRSATDAGIPTRKSSINCIYISDADFLFFLFHFLRMSAINKDAALRFVSGGNDSLMKHRTMLVQNRNPD
jgi:hypothetical protein